ncbi:MAG: lysophospholipid acyltransferase family protein [Candidatus Aminicenantes bacterium]|nr:lysophospholipid acyltransferase family protein [Candidatus Aminicenantes bacterium]
MQKKEKQVKLKHRIEYFVFSAFTLLVKLSPLFLMKINRKILCFLFKKTNKRYARIVDKNLEIAFPKAPEQEISNLKDKVYRHFSRILIEILYMFVKKNPSAIIKNIEVNHRENLEKALEKKKGVIIFTAHFGNWELVPYILNRKLGRRVFGIAREMRNPLVEKIVKQSREKMGLNIIYKDNSIRSVLRALQDNEIVYFLIDQHAIRREGVVIDFFGKKVNAVTSVSRMHIKNGVPIVPLFLHYEEDKVVLNIHPEVPFHKSADSSEDIKKLTEKCNAKIEEEIKKHPEQWFWFHNRWRDEIRRYHETRR